MAQPATVVRWHREGFKRYWRWRSRSKTPGRSKIDAEIRQLIKQMYTENPLWGAPRILSELQLLGYSVAERTVAKYMIRDEKPRSQTWRTFLDNQLQDIVAIDFFTAPTATFRVLYCFVVLRHAPGRGPANSRYNKAVRKCPSDKNLRHSGLTFNRTHLEFIVAQKAPSIPLPTNWPKHVKTGILHVIALAQMALTAAA